MNDSSKLTKNQKDVLKKIIDHGRVSDTEISKEMAISQQAVQQIRKRLEDLKIIKGYMPIIDFKKIGINLFYFAGIEVLPSLWKKFSEAEINKRLLDIPFLFEAFRISSSDISYLLIFGFKSISDKESFTKKIEKALSNDMNVKWDYICGVENMLAYDSLNLVFHYLDRNPINTKKIISKLNEK